MAQVDDDPTYLDELEIGDERKVRRRIEELEAELETLQRGLEDARRAKKILCVTDRELDREVVRFLSEDLHLRAELADTGGEGAPEGSGEAFRLLDDSGEAWCLGEVRASPDGNVCKEDLARAIIHRSAARRQDDDPVLLVVNTYYEGRAVESRDHPVPPDMVRRAAEDHVVVARTMDLLRLGQRASNGFPAAEQLAETLRSGGGWLEVDASLTATHRTS